MFYRKVWLSWMMLMHNFVCSEESLKINENNLLKMLWYRWFYIIVVDVADCDHANSDDSSATQQ